jgi:hypothetical protein
VKGSARRHGKVRTVKTRFLAAFVLALSVTGCTKAVEITKPNQSTPLNAPLTQFEVKFATFYSSGFRAFLDGVDVTSQFAPPAAKGGTSTMNMPDDFEKGGFRSGARPIPTGDSPSRPPVATGAVPPSSGGSPGSRSLRSL